MNQHKQPISNVKSNHKNSLINKIQQINLPKLKNRNTIKKHSLQNHKENISQLPPIKIDSMPHIDQQIDQNIALEIGKAKISQRVIGSKNTFLQDVQSNLKKVLNGQLFTDLSSLNNLQNDDDFQKDVQKNINIIKNIQLKKVISVAEKKVVSAMQRHSERKRQLSIQFQTQQISKKFDFNKQNNKNQENIIERYPKSQKKEIKGIKSAKHIDFHEKSLIKKCKSFQKMEVKSNNKKQLKSIIIQPKSIGLYKQISDYLQKPNRRRERQTKIVQSIQKCKQQLQRKLQQVQEKLRKRAFNNGQIQHKQNVLQNNIQEKTFFNMGQKTIKSKNQPWSQTAFQKQWIKITNIQKKNDDFFQNYLQQKKVIINLEYKKKQIASKKTFKTIQSNNSP